MLLRVYSLTFGSIILHMVSAPSPYSYVFVVFVLYAYVMTNHELASSYIKQIMSAVEM